MTTQLTELWREVFEAADRALELEPSEREKFLDRCLEEHPEIGAELKALIDAAAVASTLETPAAEFAAPFLNGVASSDDPSTNGDNIGAVSMFGPYRVRREIGSGGMGAVYLAERSDDQYRKEVALKILPRWSGGDQRRLHRFLEERQILATLDHPGIARLLDGGVSADGQPWFAMEYIDGQPIDKYCDQLRLPVEERLTLFCDVCSAVQYAHRSLVVHRDLKPSNILVSADGRVALLDFGIARLLADDAMSNAPKTIGDRLMTPLYASPEQIRGEPASTSADVYALGVLLHVLLTGGRPYRLSTFESYEIARAVLEQEPERPSVSAVRENGSAGAAADQPPAVARAVARATTQVKLVRRLRGDLDAIVLKAMAKDPSRRYSTVEQLQTDVRRHLTGLPVLAQPESRSYLTRKFIRRHRIGVAMTSAAAVLVVGFAAVMTVQRSRIRVQAERIALERDRAEQVSQNFMSIFQTIAPADRSPLARDILDSAAARIDQQMVDHPEPRARLMFDMAGAYHRLELYDRARGLLETSLALRRNLSPKPALDIAATLNLFGAVLFAQGSVARSEQAYDEALRIRRQELGPRNADVARTLVGLSAVRRVQRRFPEAEQLAREAVAIDRSRGRDGRADLARSTSALAGAVDAKGDHSGAAALFREALALMRETHPEEHGEVAVTVLDLAGALYSAGDKRSADSLVRYGMALNRRLFTGGVLSGTASVPPIPNSDPIANVNETVRRAFAERPTPSKAESAGANANSSQIAFTTDRDGPDATGNFGNEEIYIMNADGTNQRRLTRHRARDTGASISPDGRKIAFQSQREGGVDIFVMNADGSDPRRLTDFTKLGLGAVDPTWSPDGKRIAFRSRVNRIDVYVINLDGTGLEKLTSDSSVVAGAPDWSPDGRRIAYTSRRHGRPDIYVMNSDGSHQIRLTFNDSVDTRPAWSPDGKRIVFYSNRDGDQEIYVMNADGTNPTRLTTNPGEDGFPSWSPDGQRIVFHRRVLGHGQLFTMNPDGSDVKRLTDLSPVAFSGFPNWGRAPR